MTEEFAKSAVVVLNTLNIHNKDDLKRAYHHLVTSFHPDNTTGDEIGFKNLQIFYDFMNTNLSLFVNKPNIDSDFNICLNDLLKSFGADTNTTDMKLIYKSLIEYADKTGQKSLKENLIRLYNEVSKNAKDAEYVKYKKEVQEFIKYYYFYDDSLKSFDKTPQLKSIIFIKEYMNKINNLINNVYVSINDYKNKNDLDNYMRKEFIKNYRDIILSFVKEYLSYYKINEEQINLKLKEYDEILQKHIKHATLKEIYEELNTYIKNIQSKSCLKLDTNFKQLNKETKGILCQLYTRKFIDSGVFSEYFDKIYQAKTVSELNDVYMDLYLNYYYDRKLREVKDKIMINFSNFTKTNLWIDQLLYINTLKKIFEMIESQTQAMNSQTLRSLEKIDFKDLSKIDILLNSIANNEESSKTFAK